MSVRIFLIATVFLSLTACGNNSEFRPLAPVIGPGGKTANGNFAQLMNALPEGRAGVTPWVGYWFPYSTGGISDAAILYEQSSGKSGAAAWETAHHGATAPGLQEWWGHCNGWAAAATIFNEPVAPKTVNRVTFETADQKALLSEIAMEVDADFFGQRNDDDNPSSMSFQDVFPDQFFLVLTNYIGNGYTLIMDRYTGAQVWNQPIAGYRHSPITPASILPPDPAAPGVTRVNMTTQVWWGRDDVTADALTGPFGFRDTDSFQSRIYDYEIWLDGPVRFDSSGKIISSGNVILAPSGPTVTGGAWKNGDADIMNSHPDYLWVAHRVSAATDFANPQVDPSWVGLHFGN